MPIHAEHDLGLVDHLEAEALGEPGNRTFRIRVQADDQSASLWMEKEQVRSLSLALQQIITQNRRDHDEERPQLQKLTEFPLDPTFDFQVSRLALAYDEDTDIASVYATDITSEDQENPIIRIAFTRAQSRIFTVQADSAIAAGRPLCPLCMNPLDQSNHLCPPSNGHSDDALSWIGSPEL